MSVWSPTEFNHHLGAYHVQALQTAYGGKLRMSTCARLLFIIFSYLLLTVTQPCGLLELSFGLDIFDLVPLQSTSAE